MTDQEELNMRERIAELGRASVHFRVQVFSKKTGERCGFAWCMIGETFVNEFGYELEGKGNRSNHGIKDLIVGMMKMKKAVSESKYSFGDKYIIDTYGKPKGLTKKKAEQIVLECWKGGNGPRGHAQ